jgi:type IV pilus assembly protein PilB
VCSGELEAAIREITGEGEPASVDVESILADVEEDDVEVEKRDEEETDLEAEAESSPVVRYVNHIIATALQEGASDIHIEPGERTLKVRMRIDGILFEMMTPPRKMHSALTSRIKIMANLDIAERRLPQDGRIRATVLGRKLDLRVSTVPTSHGEKTVMRILDDRAIQVSLDDLGFSEDTLLIWKKQIEQPHGIILVTGPTGSGKTTTLYSSLRQMDLKRLNISTVEDPVEYALEGVTQIQTHNAIDMTFSRALKALLRQDPDVVMVGEIRDHETASIAVQAALTGHLVLSTLHTNDAPSSVTRLINIGVEPFLVGAALNGVLAQRLVRRICPHCSGEVEVPEDMREFLAVHGLHTETLPQGKGCESCRQTGYAGRVGLYELLVLDDHLRDLIASNPNVTEFRRLCCERGMVTLREDGFSKVAQGRTTVEEVLRVTEATI